MGTAIFGLVGVILGSFLTIGKEWWFQRRKDRKDMEYLAIQVLCQLERYVAGCADVVGDNGQPDKDGYNRVTVLPPKFEPELLKVEWKSLPTDLLYEILDFPYRAEVASLTVSAVLNESTPPDRSEGFEERQYQYAALGIDASRLATELREHVGLPKRGRGNWDPVAYMEEEKSKIEASRQGRIN